MGKQIHRILTKTKLQMKGFNWTQVFGMNHFLILSEELWEDFLPLQSDSWICTYRDARQELSVTCLYLSLFTAMTWKPVHVFKMKGSHRSL